MKSNFKFGQVLAGMAMVAAGGGLVPMALARGSAMNANAREVEIPLQAVLAPIHGYDDNDNIEVVVHGMLPNGCYSLGRTEIDGVGEGNILKVRQYAIRDLSGICVEDESLPPYKKAAVPFTAEASVGTLAAGRYMVEYHLENRRMGQRPLVVIPATAPTIDSLPYAATTTAISSDVVNGIDHISVTLSGVLNSSCTELNDHIQIRKEGDVYVVMPTIQVKSGVVCAQILRPFSRKVDLGKAGAPGYYLIHVRSMNGKAVNQVIQVMR